MLNMTRISLIIFMILSITACSNLLPGVKQSIQSPWMSFADAKLAFDKVIPEKTTEKDLKKLGFDPFLTPNVHMITYLEVIQQFVPNQSVQMHDLPKGIHACIKAQSACKGYAVAPKVLNSKRYGNAFLDLLNFRRKTITTGWKFTALIVLKKDLVVYKLWGGEPNVVEFEDKKNPLGPIQNIGDIGQLLKY